MSNKWIAYIVVLACFSYSTLYAKKKHPKTVKIDRKIKVLMFPFETDLTDAYNSYIRVKIKTSLYDSKKYELVEKDEKKLAADINFAKNKWKCKNTESTVSILATISEFDYQFDVAILVEIKGKIASLKVIKSKDSELLLLYSETITQFSDLSAFVKKISGKLVDDIKNKYIKPDLLLEWELSVSAAYTFNIGSLRYMLRNGFGAYADLRAYGLYRNLFLKTSLGFFRFSGVNYASDTAYFFPVDIGAGYTFQPGLNHFTISPYLGVGGIITYMKTGAFTNINQRGILKDEHAQDIIAAPQTNIGCKFEYQWHNFKAFASVSFNIYIQKTAIYNQIIPSVGVLYMF